MNGFRLLCILVFLLQSSGYSQDLSGFIYDSKTGEPLPYTTVYNRNTKRGTLSDDSGYFLIERRSTKDTIQFSFVGYLSMVDTYPNSETTVRLKPRNVELNTVLVLGDNTMAYAMLAEVGKNEPSKIHQSKAYYGLQTEKYDVPVEFIEGYYTATTSGYDIDDLSIKNGRIAYNAESDQFSLSTNTTRVFELFETAKPNLYFPDTPLSLSRRKLHKYYDLRITGRFEEGEQVVYQIKCESKNEEFFDAEIWVDSTHSLPVKIHLWKTDAQAHPFIPMFSDTIKQVDLDIVKQFKRESGELVLDYSLFSYRADYRRSTGEAVSMSTSALLGHYEYGTTFHPLLFDFDEYRDEDYRQINALPYDRFFWSNYKDYRQGNPMSIDESWFEKEGALTHEDLLKPSDKFSQTMLEHRYIHWEQNQRVRIRDTRDLEEQLTQILPADRYHLHGQLLLNAYVLKGSLHTQTAAIFDPYKTFYNDEMTPNAMAFINIYFDLVEIQHRKMDQMLGLATNYSEAAEIYKRHVSELEKQTNKYINEVDRGTNEEMLVKWNDYVVKELDIDNIELFGVTFE